MIERYDDACNILRNEMNAEGIDGPWMTEYDHIEWDEPSEDGDNPLFFKIKRNNFSMTLCGYIGFYARLEKFSLKKNNGQMSRQKIQTWKISSSEYYNIYSKHFYELSDQVHGGFTYKGMSYEKSEPIFWSGFDCAHSLDFIPSKELSRMKKSYVVDNNFFSAYRDMRFVKRNLLDVADLFKVLKSRIGEDRENEYKEQLTRLEPRECFKEWSSGTSLLPTH